MKNFLCSENFKNFFSNIEKVGVPVEQLATIIGNELYNIADDVFLGRCACEFHASPMPYSENGREIITELFLSPSGFDNDEVRTEHKTGDNGKVVFRSYPIKGRKWNRVQKEEIEFLHKSMFVIFGRARLTDIIKATITRDALTKLPNTAGFLAVGNGLAAQNKLHEYNAMYLNLKNFRCINSQIGGKHGDKVIIAYAKALHDLLSDDEYAARLGGDNFTLLVKKETTDMILENLTELTIEVQLDSTKMSFAIASRIGMYNIESGDKMPHVMDCIATAVGSARRNPALNVVIFTPEIMKRVAFEHTLTSLFPIAIKNREFVVYYQPKIDLTESCICGCEALVRWNRDGKLVSPADFIPVFERDGNVCTLDFYILDCVCRDIASWLSRGIEPVTVSVNFSKTHLHDPNLAQEIIDIINKYGIDTKYIEVEMTEMSDFNDYDAFKHLVSTMKNNGVVTSIDDFGTGYSSLNLLTDFMFDVVKLDKSFLDNISRTQSKTDEIVVRNIVKMIRELGMRVIAEGVETVEQAKFLKSIDCSMVQGYLYDRPLCVEEFIKRLQKRNYEKLL